MILLDGKTLAESKKIILRERVHRVTQKKGRPPGLAVILVGENPASQIYVKRKQQACQSVGIHSFVHFFPPSFSQDLLFLEVQRLNEDPEVDGILLQLPLPHGLDVQAALRAISPEKDVDGLHPHNQGLLFQGNPRFIPCTPQGCLDLIALAQQSISFSLKGLSVVMIGRSLLVGRPLALMLSHLNATVTLAHSHTENLAALCRSAQLVITAVGAPNLIGPEHVTSESCVIDVGIHRDPHGRVRGDVNFEAIQGNVRALTPVPGGVGPMTIVSLLANTLTAAESGIAL